MKIVTSFILIVVISIFFSGCPFMTDNPNNNIELDNSFDGDGIVVHNDAAGGDANDKGFSIALDSDGNVYVTGYSINGSGNTDMVIWKYDSNGNPDISFDDDGLVVYDGATGEDCHDIGYSIKLDSANNIYVTRSIGESTAMVIWKYSSNGILDTSFDDGGIVISYGTDDQFSTAEGHSITLDSVNNIYITGSCYNPGFRHDMAIWNNILTLAELNAVSAIGDSEHNLVVNGTNYQSAGHLIHWWKFGVDATDIGRDYVDEGFNIGLTDPDGIGIDSGDIVTSQPVAI